jgi:hypothetical protein
MPEAFVPLMPGTVKTPEAPFTSFNTKSAVTGKPAGAEAHSAKPEACAKPQVTLQRNGDIVTGIRVQCGCGQVIELNCVY